MERPRLPLRAVAPTGSRRLGPDAGRGAQPRRAFTWTKARRICARASRRVGVASPSRSPRPSTRAPRASMASAASASCGGWLLRWMARQLEQAHGVVGDDLGGRRRRPPGAGPRRARAGQLGLGSSGRPRRQLGRRGRRRGRGSSASGRRLVGSSPALGSAAGRRARHPVSRSCSCAVTYRGQQPRKWGHRPPVGRSPPGHAAWCVRVEVWSRGRRASASGVGFPPAPIVVFLGGTAHCVGVSTHSHAHRQRASHQRSDPGPRGAPRRTRRPAGRDHARCPRHCRWPESSISTWSRWRRWPTLPSAGSWTTASTSTRRPSGHGSPGARAAPSPSRR